MKSLLAILFLTAALSFQVSAQDAVRGEGIESGFGLIYQASSDQTFDGGSQLSLDSDWGFSFTLAYRFNQRFELGFELDWQNIDYDATLRSALVPDSSIEVSGDLEAFTPRIFFNYNFTRRPLTPFITGGVGWSFIDTNIPNGQIEIGCWWDPWWGQVCTPYQDTKTVDDLVYHIGAGLRWDSRAGYTLRLGYEKHWFDYGNATSAADFDQWKLGIVLRL